MSGEEFERLLGLIDALDSIQLLRLQCKVSSLIGDPPGSDAGWRPEGDTLPPPSGLHGHYAADETTAIYEDIEIKWDDE